MSKDTQTPRETAFTAEIVDIQAPSGLIEQCSECGLTYIDGECPKHGSNTDTEYALQLMTIVDTGDTTERVYFDAKTTETITGLDLDEAIELAEQENGNINAVMNTIRANHTGTKYHITGTRVEDHIIAEEVVEATNHHATTTDGGTTLNEAPAPAPASSRPEPPDEPAPERTTRFTATIQWGEDATREDKAQITDAVEHGTEFETYLVTDETTDEQELVVYTTDNEP